MFFFSFSILFLLCYSVMKTTKSFFCPGVAYKVCVLTMQDVQWSTTDHTIFDVIVVYLKFPLLSIFSFALEVNDMESQQKGPVHGTWLELWERGVSYHTF